MANNHPNRKKKAKPTKAAQTAAPPRAGRRADRDHDLDYSALLQGARRSFDNAAATATHVFRTDASGLWENYLDALPEGRQRQIHNCHCCRRFIETYGGLVSIDGAGVTTPLMWDINRVPAFYAPAFARLEAIVDNARVIGVFFSKQKIWGTPQTGDWHHLSVVPPANLVFVERALDPNQAMAGVKENTGTVMRAMAEYGPKVLDEALRLLAAESLDRSEKFVGPIRWLRELHDWPKGRENHDVRQNLLWRRVAAAPEGFCHIKSSVVGPLLDDIAAGVPFDDIRRKHAAKLAPDRYQRPQAPPAAGNVKAAEALVAKLGIARSLERRFARLDELPLVDAFWTPQQARPGRPQEGGGVFSHVKTKQGSIDEVPPVNLPEMTVTWDKFLRTGLTLAPDQIEILIPDLGPFYAMTTAEHADAPPILKWDRPEERNPVSAYTYVKVMPARHWSLTPRVFAKVNAIVALPNMWGTKPMPHVGVGAVLIIDGCVDTKIDSGNGLFPESLREELHGVRSTVEAYAKTARLGGREAANACGYGISQRAVDIHVRLHVGDAWNYYHIDRWD